MGGGGVRLPRIDVAKTDWWTKRFTPSSQSRPLASPWPPCPPTCGQAWRKEIPSLGATWPASWAAGSVICSQTKHLLSPLCVPRAILSFGDNTTSKALLGSWSAWARANPAFISYHLYVYKQVSISTLLSCHSCSISISGSRVICFL